MPAQARNWAYQASLGIGSFFSIQVQGYYVATQTGVHNFQLTSDDSSHLWLGFNATIPITKNLLNYKSMVNASVAYDAALVNDGELHAPKSSNTSFFLTQGSYYPLRILCAPPLRPPPPAAARHAEAGVAGCTTERGR